MFNNFNTCITSRNYSGEKNPNKTTNTVIPLQMPHFFFFSVTWWGRVGLQRPLDAIRGT